MSDWASEAAAAVMVFLGCLVASAVFVRACDSTVCRSEARVVLSGSEESIACTAGASVRSEATDSGRIVYCDCPPAKACP